MKFEIRECCERLLPSAVIFALCERYIRKTKLFIGSSSLTSGLIAFFM